MACARNAIHTFVQRLVEHHSHAGMQPRTREGANQECEKNRESDAPDCTPGGGTPYEELSSLIREWKQQ